MKNILIFVTFFLLTGCSSFTPESSQGGFTESTKTLVEMVASNGPKGNIKEGVFLLQKGRLLLAQEQFNLAIQKDQSNSYYHYLTALCYHLRFLDGDSSQIEFIKPGYRQAILLDPTNWLAMYQLALFFQDTRDWDNALKTWLMTLNFKPNDPEVLRNAIYTAYYARELTAARNLLSTYKKQEQSEERYNEIATIILAAAGESTEADYLLAALPDTKKTSLQGRVSDWSELHKLSQARFREISNRDIGIQAAKGVEPSSQDYLRDINDQDDESDETTELTPSRALAVDVVIIRTTEEVGTSKGINILKQLELSVGRDRFTEKSFSENSSLFIEADGSATPTQRSKEFGYTEVISKAISIPQINYSMNIANVSGNRNEVLARPTLIVQDGEFSTFFSGSHINAVAVGGVEGATESIDVDVGVYLSVGAVFHSDDEFTLTLEAERTFLQEPNRSAVTFPLFVSFSKTRAEATVRMKYGQTLVLSGLSEKESTTSRDEVPFLGDIPFIQYFFATRTTREFQSSVVLLVTPHPPQYIYSDNGQEPLSELQGLFGTHWKPYPNISQVFQHMEANRLFRAFRTGDVRVESWLTRESFGERLRESLKFVVDY